MFETLLIKPFFIQVGLTIRNEWLVASLHNLEFTDMSLSMFSNASLLKQRCRNGTLTSKKDKDDVAEQAKTVGQLMICLDNYVKMFKMIHPLRWEAVLLHSAINHALYNEKKAKPTPEIIEAMFQEHLTNRAASAVAMDPPHDWKDLQSFLK